MQEGKGLTRLGERAAILVYTDRIRDLGAAQDLREYVAQRIGGVNLEEADYRKVNTRYTRAKARVDKTTKLLDRHSL